MEAGVVTIPYVLLRHYRSLHLSDTEVMLLIQLLAFRQAEHNDFPTLDELMERMDLPAETLGKMLQKLMQEGWISIESGSYEQSDVQYDRYQFTGLYRKLAEYVAAERRPALGGEPDDDLFSAGYDPEDKRNLFTIFEREFGRPLSPMEFETISGWVDQDKYPEDLILMALKESVFAGKVHFRYIDRILLEWERNRVRSAEDVKAYTQKFRTGGRS
ncbi:DnaD domain-containing protein [Paenibacillus sp. P96]|uniref:DnaD domain-containing protein n=1 Tax=Paenibacillus zeirhizosphaerae TaxID=2987519 RepID=A0ABT9FPG2_9BACL|nr:DnaD domain-containing protein [Paenibacillus sp. P96]MDP4096604.1 DnaD domain-containing protein [Paenibacillus sp. P96]